MISASAISGEHAAAAATAASRMTYDQYINNAPERTKVPEFLRPLPKPARYHNGEGLLTSAAAAAYQPSGTFCGQYSPSNLRSDRKYAAEVAKLDIKLNGVRPGLTPPRPAAKYPVQQRPLEEAVNLVHKREYNGVSAEDYQTASQQQQPSHPPTQQHTRLFVPAPVTSQGPQYTAPYSTSAQYMPLYFSAQAAAQQQQRPQFTAQQYAHVPQYSPPKAGQSVLKAEKPPVATAPAQLKPPFKVPSGKEGSLKHRILTRPTPGGTPEKRSVHPSGAHFARGSLIQLASGELRRIEEMRAEDFVSAAERNPALRLDPSTVVRLTEHSQRPHEGTVTLSYGRQGSQHVELEVTLEHPFFVYGKGWASISPERSLQNFGLACHRLAVGDICIALSPRPKPLSQSEAELHRKRRWSAPDQFASDDENEPSPPQRTKDTVF